MSIALSFNFILNLELVYIVQIIVFHVYICALQLFQEQLLVSDQQWLRHG